MRKFMAVFLSPVLILGTSIPAFAEGEDGNNPARFTVGESILSVSADGSLFEFVPEEDGTYVFCSKNSKDCKP